MRTSRTRRWGIMLVLAMLWAGWAAVLPAVAAEPTVIPVPQGAPVVVVPAPSVIVVQPPPKTEADNKVRNVAIFIKNAAGTALDDKVTALADLVSSRITDLGFSVISRDEVVNAVAALAGGGANTGQAGGPGADLDAILSNQTSALRLAQNMGADYVFSVTMATLGTSKKNFNGYGVASVISESKLRLTYKLLDKYLGGSLTGDTVEAAVKTRVDANSSEQPDVINDLIDQAAQKLAESLAKKIAQNKIREATGQLAQAGVTIVCHVQGMVVPDVVKDGQGNYQLTTHECKLEAMNVTVECNGMVVGTAPGTFPLPKGISKLRLRRDGCKDFEGTITPTDGQTLSFDMQMSDEGYARWKDMTAFLADLKAGEKLTDAQVKVLEGYAQMLRQSGYKVDVKVDDKSDVKIDTDLKGTTFNTTYKSLW